MRSISRRSLLMVVAVFMLLWLAPFVHASAVTSVTVTSRTKFLTKRAVFGSCVLSTSYSAGGDTLAAGDVGLRSIENLVVLNGQSGGYTLGFNGITSNTAKIQAYKSGLPASAVPLPGLATITHNATKYIGMDGAEAATAAAACPFVVPAAGKIVGMRASLGTAPSSTYSYTLTLMKNGSAGTNTFAITGTAVSGSDSAHSDTVAAGDLVTVKAVDSNASSTAATLGLSLLYIPDPIEASGNLSGVTVYFMAVGT